MEQLSLDISIAKIVLLNYFINCWCRLSYRQNMHLPKKGKQIWKLSKIVYNVCREGHFHLWIKILSIINQERVNTIIAKKSKKLYHRKEGLWIRYPTDHNG